MSPLSTYKALGFNTVPQLGAANTLPTPSERQTAEWEGLMFGPQLPSPWSGMVGHLSATVATVDSANMSSLCPGLAAAQEVTERMKWRQAAAFRQAVLADCNSPAVGCNDAYDMAYNGCLLEKSLNATAALLELSQPDVAIYDIEGWTHWELWQTNVARSRNAQSQRLHNESLAQLARRMSENWLHTLSDAAKRVSPKTALALWDSEAQDDKGCCSGSNKGTFDWKMVEGIGAAPQPPAFSSTVLWALGCPEPVLANHEISLRTYENTPNDETLCFLFYRRLELPRAVQWR